MQRRFADKVVIITGSTSGIGQAAAYRFGQEGAFLTIHGRNQDGMQETLRKLREMGVKDDRILQVFGDVREEKTLKDIVEKTVQKFGRIDVLVNNAGTIAEEEGFHNLELESLDTLLDINLKSCIKLVNFALPYLEKTKGNIVNVSSVDGKKAHPENMYYSVAKAALDHYTRNASVLFAEKNVRINNLNPGFIRTQLKLRGGTTEQGLEKLHESWIKRNVPMKRAGEPQEMANVIWFLASDEASFITGSIVVADGGMRNYVEPQKPSEKM